MQIKGFQKTNSSIHHVIFFESLDCSFGVRSSKGTGADLPDAAKIWPDADMMQPAFANHGHAV